MLVFNQNTLNFIEYHFEINLSPLQGFIYCNPDCLK